MNKVKKINASAKSQLELLEAMTRRLELGRIELEGGVNNLPKDGNFEMSDLVALSGLQDVHEVQRFLFILEGQRMVQPVPEGDLTSSVWTITDLGLEALRKYKGHLEAA